MATLILKSLVTGYILVMVFGLVVFANVGEGPIWFTLIFPIFVWPGTLIVSALALLVFRSIEENR